MINFTIKTLDSNNHPFSVEDEITILQLKEKLRESLGIEITQQRLIFCGRVLQDEKKLAEYDVNGKVVHLVQRMPPSAEARASSNSTNSATPPPHSHAHNDANNPGAQLRRLMEVQTLSPTASRMEFIRRMIIEIRNAIAALRVYLDDDEESSSASRNSPRRTSAEPMETDTPPTATIEEADGNYDDDGPDSIRALHARRRMQAEIDARQGSQFRAIRTLRSRNARPRDFSQMLDELEILADQFAPYRALYIRMLRNCSNNESQPSTQTDEERQREQRTVDMITDVMHSFAHAYHAASDITLQLGQRTSRLTSEATMRHPIPMQAHFNVVQPNRAGQQPAGANAAGNGGTQPSAPTAGDNVQANQPAQAGQGQPDPITYQLEIETRMPIAIALENALLNGLGGGQPVAPEQAAQNGAQNAAQTAQNGQAPENQPGQQNPAAAAGQANRRQVLLDFENLFRGLTQGVEVVMSMEEVAPTMAHGVPFGGLLPAGFGGVLTGGTGGVMTGGTGGVMAGGTGGVMAGGTGGVMAGGTGGVMTGGTGVTTGETGVTTGGTGVTTSGTGVTTGGTGVGAPNGTGTAAPTGAAGNGSTGGVQAGVNAPFGIPAAAVDATGAIPGLLGADIYLGALPWGLLRQGAPGADMLQNIVASVLRQGIPAVGVEGTLQAVLQTFPEGLVGMTGQGTGQTANAGQTGQAGQSPAAQATAGQSGNGTQNAQQAAQQASLQLRRAATARAQALSMANLVYDRFLACDSHHARRRLQRRREQHAQQVAAQERVRADRAASQTIEILRERNPRISEPHMQQMVRLINSTPSQEAWMNALMVVCARHLFLAEAQGVAGDPPMLPHEFRPCRLMLRNYMEHLLQLCNAQGELAYVSAADYLVDQQIPFLTNMGSIVSLRDDIDLYQSLKALIRCRLPALVRCVMSDVSSENFAMRFYQLFANLFSDTCILISRACVDEYEGLRAVFRAFMEQALQGYDEPVRDMLMTLSQHNLEAAIPNMEAQYHNIEPYIINPNARRQEPEEESAMETSPRGSPPAEPPTEAAPEPEAPAQPEPAAAPPATEPAPADAVSAASPPSTSSNMRIPKIEITNANDQEGSDDVRFVPPMVLLQHWGEEWLPVFTRDQQRQTERPLAEPLSDAYLAGTPARKRRCLRAARPPTHPDSLFNLSMREALESQSENATSPPERLAEAAQSQGSVECPALRRAFRERVRAVAESRAAASPDYEPQRFSAADRFLAPLRNNPERPESIEPTDSSEQHDERAECTKDSK